MANRHASDASWTAPTTMKIYGTLLPCGPVGLGAVGHQHPPRVSLVSLIDFVHASCQNNLCTQRTPPLLQQCKTSTLAVTLVRVWEMLCMFFKVISCRYSMHLLAIPLIMSSSLTLLEWHFQPHPCNPFRNRVTLRHARSSAHPSVPSSVPTSQYRLYVFLINLGMQLNRAI